MADVLIIDDSLTVRMDLKQAIEGAGHSTVLCDSLAEARQVLADETFGVIILDVLLPDGDGVEMLREIKSDPRSAGIPVMLLSTEAEVHDRIRGMSTGADDYIGKPYDRNYVIARANQLLNREKATGPSQTLPGIEAAERPFGPKRVMAVDDSPTYLHQLAEQLRQDGIEVVLARSGEEALELLTVKPVDAILLDLIMPGMSGQETCRRIKNSPPWRSIALLMLTGLEDREAMLASFNAGADDFIPKSSDFAVLRARLRAQLRRKQFEEENRRIREQLHQKEVEAAEARANRELAEARASLLADLEKKNAELEENNRAMLALYAELDERANSLQRANELKGKVLFYVSHEFRTPVSSILSLSRMLLEHRGGAFGPEQQKQVTYIRQAAESLSEMVEDLLDSARMEAGKATVRPSEFRVDELFGTLRGLFRPFLADKPAVNLVFDEPTGLPPMHADESKVGQILRNFISNALKFTESGEVRVSASQEDGRIIFAVADTGIGIAPEDQERIFQEFSQIDHPLQRQHKGTGLGLPLSRRLTEVLGGRLRVQSKLGVGSTFYAEIPIDYHAPAPPTPPMRPAKSTVHSTAFAPSPQPAASHGHILIIDDDEIARYLLTDVLQGLGYEVIEADTGAEGLRLTQELHPEAVVLDLVMPHMSGFEVLDRLKADDATSAVPVIIYSSKRLEPDEREHMLQQAAAILTKEGAPREQIVRKMREALSQAGLVHVQ